jgi:predicted nucleotidyltransferase
VGIAERWKRFKVLPPDVPDRLKILRPVFEELGAEVAYLFGSLAAGRTANDVDIAVSCPGCDVLSIRAKVAETLGTERVDVVDLRAAPPVWRFEILRNGRLIYAVDDETANRFEMETIHEYRDTAPLRKRLREHLGERFA